MDNRKVSIVICTYNRASFLLRTLQSLDALKYRNFEVIVVNGPSSDETMEILQLYKYRIKIRLNPERNLSISRNIGIKASAGDIVALLDDDAIPDPSWLDDILSYYTDDSVGGVGGKVYGPGGDHFQFTNGTIDIWGQPDALRQMPGDFNDPDGKVYNIMMGTNSTFRRKALLEVGGFDEYYEYYHDESDVDVRLIRHGYKILHHPCAYVHHEFAKSYIRKSTYNLNWYPIGKNTVYFGIKNSEGFGDLENRKKKVMSMTKEKLKEFEYWLNQGYISKDDYKSFVDMWNKGCEKGLFDSVNQQRRLNYDLDPDSEFLPYDLGEINKLDNKLCICMLCQDNPIEQVGGVAKYTWQLARGYAREGHQVHILTNVDTQHDLQQENIYIHKVKHLKLGLAELESYTITLRNIQHSYSCYKIISELNKIYNFDIIESPIWDFEGVIPAKLLGIPLVTRLETPLLKAAETQKWKINDDIKLSSDFERSQIQLSSGIIAISENIKETISQLYGINFNTLYTKTIYLGIESSNATHIVRDDSKNINILFVGRLERRKGIHILLEVIPEILQKYRNVTFTFVGDDTVPDENGELYKLSFLKKHSNSDFINRVEFRGKVDEDELDICYKNCDIFVSPSLYESFGIVFIEAMSYGKPVIGGKAGGMQEIIDDGETGFLVEPDNACELSDKLRILIEDSKLRVAFGENAYKKYNSIFKTDVMCKESLDFYRNIMHRYYKRIGRDTIDKLADNIINRKKPVRISNERIEKNGWNERQIDYWKGKSLESTQKGAYIKFNSDMKISVRLLKHGWSGIIEVTCDGELIERLDLFSENIDRDYSYLIENIDNKMHVYNLIVTGEKSKTSHGCEIWIEGVYEYGASY